MKLLTTLTLLVTIAISSNTVAHDGGHGAMGADRAVSLAQTSAKMLTFKSHNMSVGKLDVSWNKVKLEQFILVEESKDNFIVKATNKANNQTLYFEVGKDGSVNEVSESSGFKQSHGHVH